MCSSVVAPCSNTMSLHHLLSHCWCLALFPTNYYTTLICVAYVLLLTLLLTPLLCYQHFSELLSIWLTLILLLLNTMVSHSKVMIHETKKPQWTLANFLQLLGLLLHIASPHTKRYNFIQNKLWSTHTVTATTLLFLLYIFYNYCNHGCDLLILWSTSFHRDAPSETRLPLSLDMPIGSLSAPSCKLALSSYTRN